MPKLFPAALLSAALLVCAPNGDAQQIHLAPELTGVAAVANDATPVMPKKPISLDLTAIDKTADPCTDFYAYACGNWQKNNTIPADKASFGRFNELSEYNLYSLYQLLEKAANHPTSPLQKKYGDYYAACMNQGLADELGTKPIQPVLDRIAKWNNKADLPALVGELEQHHGYSFFYGFGSEADQKHSTMEIAAVNQGGLSLPDRDYYLQNDERTTKIRAQFVEHVTKMFVLLGDTPEQASAEAKAVMAIETALAKGSLSRVDRRNPANVYHMESAADLQALSPEYRWGSYFGALQVPVSTLNVSEPEFVKAMNAEIAAAPVADLKSYMRWHVLSTDAQRLSTPFDEEAFRFTAVLSGQEKQEPRWKRCTRSTDRALGEAVGQDWVAQYFPTTSKAKMEELIHALEVALGQDIQSLDWMSPATKTEAQKKLASFRQKIGYPEKWRDYSKLEIKRDDRLGNGERNDVFEDHRDLVKIGKPVDEKEWGMTPPTVNAYYNPSQNDINFPAGILQPPFFDPGKDPAVNFGAIGVVIGHEMTHGFDDQGSKYDEAGNVRDWWTKEDQTKFDAKTACEVKEYGGFEAAPGANLNGKLTLGENTADNGGVRIAYAALHSQIDKGDASKKMVDGYTPDQRFFLGFAQVWCENRREQFARMMVKVDPHSPGRFRTNGTVQNFDKFGQAFQCKQGSAMYPAEICRVW